MTPSHLLPLAILLLTTLAAPSSPSHPRQEVSLVPQPAQAPCDAYSETCRPVIQANACFAAFISFGTKPEILQCVDDQNEGRAEELLCACYGCSETVVQDWATGTLGCKPPASG